MNITLSPELQRFVDSQVESGVYPSAQELLEAAVARLMLDPAPIVDEETIAALEEGEAELDRGEGMPMEEVFQRLRQKYSGK